jgi:elongation factor 1 alpha-like protein
MSRHRNVRQLVEDDYDDYYDDDDDYDDGYDEYDDYPATTHRRPPASKQTVGGVNKQQQQQQQQQQPVKKKNVVASNVPNKTLPPVAKHDLTAAANKPAAAAAAASLLAAPSPTTANYNNNNNSNNKTTITSRPIPNILLAASNTANTATTNNNKNNNNKPPLTLVILGHVDAGKSTVTGHLLYDCSHSSPNNTTATTNYNKRLPVNYAWLLDEDTKEQEHGVTMDIATKTLETKRFHIVLQDAPGHADYVPAMITGTSNADACLLVVDATDVSTAVDAGQLKEHVYLARGLGVTQMLVVVNKMDVLAWSQDAFETVVQQLTPFLTQIGFGGSDSLRFLPVSGLTGTNIVQAASRQTDNGLDTSWYKGPTLLQALDEFDAPTTLLSKQLEKPLRIVVTDVIGEQGKGIAVRGKVAQGWVQNGDSLLVLPVAESTTIQKISSLHTCVDPERRKYAAAGEMIDFQIQNIDIMRVATGNILVRPNERPPLAKQCRAKVWILEGLTIPIIRGAQAIFHMHHLDIPCHMSALCRTLKKDGSTLKDRPRALTSNTQAVVELTLNVPIVMEAFADCRAMGRFVLRRSGQSIAVGRIEAVLA